MSPPKRKPNTLGPEQKARFAVHVKRWRERLGLQGWRVEPGSKAAKGNAMAEVTISRPDRLVTYRVGDFGAAEITDASLEATAVHELLHVLLAELVNQVEYGIEDDSLRSAEHSVVNVLEQLLLHPTE